MRRLPTILSATLLASCLPIPAAFANAQDDCENAKGETAIEMACGKLIESAAANREDLFNAHATAGVAYRDSGLGDQAISEYSKAIAIEPNSAIVRVLRGQAFNKAHARLREAVGDFTKAIQIDPKFVLAYVGRGAALHALNETDKALADLARAIQLDPTSVADLTRSTPRPTKAASSDESRLIDLVKSAIASSSSQDHGREMRRKITGKYYGLMEQHSENLLTTAPML